MTSALAEVYSLNRSIPATIEDTEIGLRVILWHLDIWTTCRSASRLLDLGLNSIENKPASLSIKDQSETMATDTTPKPLDADAFPHAAQVPLKSFDLPRFPPEASKLRELVLTADIKLDEYQSLVAASDTTSASPAALPQSITSLTLELFHLGFPPGFLSSLASALPNLRSVTLFSSLVDGLSKESRADAEEFFALTPLLKDLHLIDCFARPGFWTSVGNTLDRFSRDARIAIDAEQDHGANGSELTRSRSESFGGDGGVKVVEISYTYRGHDDPEFMGRVGGEEWPSLLVPGLAAFTAGFLAPPEDTEGESGDGKKQPLGVLPFASDGRTVQALRSRFEKLPGGDLGGIKGLDLSMYALSTQDVGHILYSCGSEIDGARSTSLITLTISVLMDQKGWFESVVAEMKGKTPELQALEIIGVPTGAAGEQQMKEQESLAVEVSGVLSQSGNKLREACPKLGRFQMSILRAKVVERAIWNAQKSEWKTSTSD